MHLLPDAASDLSAVVPSYPLAYVLVWAGALLLPIVETMVLQSGLETHAASGRLDQHIEMGQFTTAARDCECCSPASHMQESLRTVESNGGQCEPCERGDCENCEMQHDPCDKFDQGHDPHGCSIANAGQACVAHHQVPHHGHSHDALILAIVEQEFISLSVKAYMLELSIDGLRQERSSPNMQLDYVALTSAPLMDFSDVLLLQLEESQVDRGRNLRSLR